MLYELPIGAFLAAFLVLVPLPWHWRARNVPTLSIITWLFVSNIILGVNAIIWRYSIEVTALVWCDITTKLQIGATMALPACCLCLCIHLERIASVREVRTTAEQRTRRRIFDIALCWGLPSISMALHYIVQGHRFDIIQYFGCRPTTYISLPAIFLVWVPQLIVVALTLGYACTALAHFFRRRLTFARHLASQTQSALTPSRYLRLMGMALTQMLWATFVTVANMWFTVSPGLRPWVSWASVHSGFSRVGVFPRLFVPQTQWNWTYFFFWTVPIGTLFFFAFFAFGQDAVKEYRACGAAVGRGVRRVIRIPEKKQTLAPAGSVARFATPSATDVDLKDIPLSPSSFATHTDADTATETDVPAYSSHGYSFDTLSTHKVSFPSSSHSDDTHLHSDAHSHFPPDINGMA